VARLKPCAEWWSRYFLTSVVSRKAWRASSAQSQSQERCPSTPAFRPTLRMTSLLAASFFVIAAFATEPPKGAGVANPAVAMLAQGRVDEVITSLQGKDDAESHNLKARAYYAEDKTDEAIREAEKSVEMQPNNAVYHLWLGRAYGQKAEKVNVFRQAGLAGKVRDQFQKAVELDGNNMDARSDLAEYYVDAPGMMGGGVDRARVQADAVVQKDAALAHFIRAKIAEKAKDWAGAEKEYKTAIEATKTPAEQWLNLASYYKDRKNTAGMVDAIKKAVAAPHKSSAVLSDAAGMLFEAGQDSGLATELAKKYLASTDKSEEAPAFKTHALLGKLLEKQGDKAGAQKEFDAAKQMARDYKMQ
jgi:tetratricopeptide (TPR) repeat protein